MEHLTFATQYLAGRNQNDTKNISCGITPRIGLYSKLSEHT